MAIKHFSAFRVAFTSENPQGDKAAVIHGTLDFFCKAKTYKGRKTLVLHTGNEQDDYDGDAILVKTDSTTIDSIIEQMRGSDPMDGYTQIYFDGRTPKSNTYDFHCFHNRD